MKKRVKDDSGILEDKGETVLGEALTKKELTRRAGWDRKGWRERMSRVFNVWNL